MQKYILIVLTFLCLPIYTHASDFKMVPQGADADMISQISVSPDSRYFACIQGSSVYKVKLWTMEGKMITTIALPQVGLAAISFSSDSKKLIISVRTNLFVYDINGVLLNTIGPENDMGYPNYYGVPACSPDGKIIASGLFDNNNFKNFWGVAFYTFQGKEMKRLQGFSQQITRCCFSPDGNFLAAISYDKKLNIYDKQGNLVRSMTGITGLEHQLTFSSDSKLILAGSYSSIKIFNIKGILLKVLDTSKRGGAIISSDAKFLLYRSFDQNSNQFIKITDLDGLELKRLPGLSSMAIKFELASNNEHLITALQNGLIQIFNIKNGQSMLLASKDEDWISYTNDGYFDCSPNGSKIVAMVKGLDAAGIDQFAIKYNRPDMILDRLNLGSGEQKIYYQHLYRKRLKKFNLTEKKLSGQSDVPEVIIGDTKVNSKKARVTCRLSDKNHTIMGYNVFINDIPVVQKHIDPVMNMEITEEIELGEGDNKIEVSCINDVGTESFRALTYASYNKPVKSDLYFLGFGVSDYKDKKLNLKYASKDVVDLEKIFTSMKSHFNHVYSKTFVDKDVTIKNIELAKNFLGKAKVDDTLVLFIAGHGVHDMDEDFTYYFLTHNTDIHNLPKTAAPFHLIEDILYGIAPRNKLFLMDTCESGEIDEESEKQYAYLSVARGIRARSIRGLKISSIKKDDAKSFRKFLLERDRFIYNDLARRSGAIVFSSSKGGEFSYEKDELQNGLFTEEIINAFTHVKADKDHDGFISTDELRDYVTTAVSHSSQNLQHPTVDRDNIYQKFKFPR